MANNANKAADPLKNPKAGAAAIGLPPQAVEACHIPFYNSWLTSAITRGINYMAWAISC